MNEIVLRRPLFALPKGGSARNEKKDEPQASRPIFPRKPLRV